MAGKLVNHVGINGSEVADGFSVFQRRSCLVLQGTMSL